ncbi:hypothetical protein ABT023_10995 [Micromonospora sp. NPDC002296]|uniref:WXG100 family type VII secretion target n=1 Tax=Micromonospora sp. NPDC002296 TaxID=3154271 RepID=UPI00332DFF2B
MGKSWEDMAREVLVEGRPADVQSAALGWKELIKNLDQVRESLETNVKDIGVVWKGPAYESFKTHIEGLAKSAKTIVEDVDSPGRGKVSIVTTLETAASQLEQAQSKMPIPAACVGDVMAARNGEVTLGVGLFETRVKADLMGSWPVEQLGKLGDWVTGWFSDQEGEARKAYNEVNDNFRDRTMEAPTSVTPGTRTDLKPDVPDLGGGPGGGGGGGVPKVGGMPGTGGIGGGPTADVGKLPDLGGGPDLGSTVHPDLSTPGIGTGNLPDTDYPGPGGLDDGYGTGLAGAGAPTTTGLGAGGGLGGSGLGGGSSAGLSGGGVGGGIPGGGALGKAVSPGLPPMMGGGAAGAGGKGAGGRLGGKAGVGGMMSPGMAGGAGGRGAGGKAAAGAGRPGGAMAGRGGMAGAGHGGAGYAEEEQPRNTWLEEDEDIWGAGGDGGPGILR